MVDTLVYNDTMIIVTCVIMQFARSPIRSTVEVVMKKTLSFETDVTLQLHDPEINGYIRVTHEHYIFVQHDVPNSAKQDETDPRKKQHDHPISSKLKKFRNKIWFSSTKMSPTSH